MRMKAVPDPMTEIIEELAVANRILGNEGVIDAFGHVSIRHPDDPGRYLLSRSRSPLMVEPDDILEYTLDSVPVKPPSAQLYSERVIHGEIYKMRPDVMAVCHHHAPAVMPFCIAGKPIVPVFHRRRRDRREMRRSGTSTTSSATPIFWWSSRRKAARSPVRSAEIRSC